MKIHQFQEGVKVQRFCLKLVGGDISWYESLRPISEDRQGMQNQFRKQYSKIGNMWEQLFHAWRSFHFDKNRDIKFTCDMPKMVTTLLGYGEPQILKVFKSTLPIKLYWVLSPIEDLRLAFETAKRILNKEKIDNC